MDYFQNQDVARKKTGLLVFLFVTAVVLIILSVYVAIAAVLGFAEPASPEETVQRAWAVCGTRSLFGMVALGTSALDRRGEPVQGGRAFRRRAYGGRATGGPVACILTRRTSTSGGS